MHEKKCMYIASLVDIQQKEADCLTAVKYSNHLMLVHDWES